LTIETTHISMKGRKKGTGLDRGFEWGKEKFPMETNQGEKGGAFGRKSDRAREVKPERPGRTGEKHGEVSHRCH